MRCICRRGLSILEVLVLLVLALIAVGLLLMFLQRLRNSADQAQCAHNLKVLGEAIHHFEGTPENMKVLGVKGPGRGKSHQFLPASRISDGYATWAVMIAPYVSAESPLAGWDQTRRYADQPAEVRERWLPEFFCPARYRESKLSRFGDVSKGQDPERDNVAGALGDYASAAGDGDPRHDWTGAEANGALIIGEVLQEKDGVILAWRSRTSLASLKRGVSYTVLLGEKHVPPDGFGSTQFGDGSLYNGGQPASFSRIGGPGYGLALYPTARYNTNFGSCHPGVCNFLMADNSIRTMAVSVSEQVLGQLIVRD